MKANSLMLCLFGAVFSLGSSVAQAEPWNLPKTLSDSNCKVGFAVDTTWHMVHGKTSALSGRAWLDNSADYKTVRAQITIPVKSFDTDDNSRDKELRKVMDEAKFPNVNLELNSVAGLCDPAGLLAAQSTCSGQLHAVLTIRDVKKEIEAPYKISLKDGSYTVEGSFKVRWADFGVEDPSIFIARVNKDVEISYQVALPK